MRWSRRARLSRNPRCVFDANRVRISWFTIEMELSLGSRWDCDAPCWAGLIAIADQVRTIPGLANVDRPGNQTLLSVLYGFRITSDFNLLGYCHDVRRHEHWHPKVSGVTGYDWSRDSAGSLATPIWWSRALLTRRRRARRP